MADRTVRDENDNGVTRRDVDMGDNTYAERYAVSQLQGTPLFYRGREFRTFFEFSTENGNAIPTGQRILIRAVFGANTLLTLAGNSLDEGKVRIRSFAGATPTGVFSVALPVIRANAMSTVPAYTSLTTFDATAPGLPAAVGVTGGVQGDVVREEVATATGQQSSVGSGADPERGLPPGAVYVLIESIGTGPAEGVIRFRWAEVPTE